MFAAITLFGLDAVSMAVTVAIGTLGIVAIREGVHGYKHHTAVSSVRIITVAAASWSVIMALWAFGRAFGTP